MGVEKSQSTVPVSRRPRTLFAPPLALDRSSPTPLYEQLRAQLGEAVLRDGDSGMRLPSTRLLARMLGVSRNTIVLAYEHLVDRGLIEGRKGSGMTVAARTSRATGPLDAQRLLREAQYPGRTVTVADPDGTPVRLVY